MKKYFGTNDTIVTELILDPPCAFDGAYLFSFKECYGGRWYEPDGFDKLLEKARDSEEGRNELGNFIAKHEDGGERWFQYHANTCCGDSEQFPLPEKFRGMKAEDVLPFAEEAFEALYTNLEKTGRKLRMSHHIDPRPENVFFRGMNKGKFQFTLIDQYHCGDAELSHHQRKYGGGPGKLRMGP